MAIGSAIGMFIAMGWSYYMATRVVPEQVKHKVEECMANEKWMRDTFQMPLALLQENVMKSLSMSAFRDIRTLNNDVTQIEDEVIDRLPDTLDAESAIKMLKIAKKRPDLIDRVQELTEFLPLLQQLGGLGSAPPMGGGGGPLPKVPF